MSTSPSVAALIEAWAAAVRAQNIDGVLHAHADDFLMFDVVGPIQINGLDAYRRTWLEQFFPWHGGVGRFDLENLAVHEGQDVAFATALLHCAGREEGRPVGFTLRLTVGLEKRNGQWIIVHEHHSEPISFDNAAIGDGAS